MSIEVQVMERAVVLVERVLAGPDTRAGFDWHGLVRGCLEDASRVNGIASVVRADYAQSALLAIVALSGASYDLVGEPTRVQHAIFGRLARGVLEQL